MPLTRREAKSERANAGHTPRAIRPMGVDMRKHGGLYGNVRRDSRWVSAGNGTAVSAQHHEHACDNMAKGLRRQYHHENRVISSANSRHDDYVGDGLAQAPFALLFRWCGVPADRYGICDYWCPIAMTLPMCGCTERVRWLRANQNRDMPTSRSFPSDAALRLPWFRVAQVDDSYLLSAPVYLHNTNSPQRILNSFIQIIALAHIVAFTTINSPIHALAPPAVSTR
jgi:hypothetical protein